VKNTPQSGLKYDSPPMRIHPLPSAMPYLLALLTAVIPVNNLISNRGGSGLFYALLVCCLIRCFTREGGLAATLRSLGGYKTLLIAFSLPLLAVLLSQLVLGVSHGTSIERGARFSLALPIMLGAFLSIDRQVLRQTTWGFIAAGWAATLIIVGQAMQPGRPVTPGYNAVGYGNLILLFMVLVLYSLPWSLTRFTRAEKFFKIVTAIALFGAFVLTQTRTGWLAIPVFFAISVLLFAKRHHPLKLIAVVVAGTLFLGALGATNPTLRERVAEGIDQTQECLTTDPIANTSVCVRLQLWRTAVGMIEDSPWLGAGRVDTFNDALQTQAEQGRVLPFVADGFGEPHNDMLQMLSGFGIFGGIALLMIYGAPLLVFVRRFRSSDFPIAARAAAATGIALTLGFAIFGVTELMFRGMRTIGMYTAMVAWLLALSATTPPRYRCKNG